MAPMPPQESPDESLSSFASLIWGTASEQPPWMWYYWAAMALAFGLLFGSFFNVVIYRVPVKKSIVVPGSHCYSCGTFLKWYDNIPLLSYVLLRGNCRTCGSHFSPRYFFVELLTGLLFLAIYWQFGPSWPLFFHLVFASLLLIGIFTDIDHFILPDSVTVGGFFFAVGAALILGRRGIIAEEYALARDTWHSFSSLYYTGSRPEGIPWWAPVGWSLASAAFGWALLWVIGYLGRMAFRKEAMGGGDIKLFAFLGAYLGAINCIWILFLSALLGSAVGLSVMAAHKLRRGDQYDELELAIVPAAESRSAVAFSQHDESGGGVAVIDETEAGSTEQTVALSSQTPECSEVTQVSTGTIQIRIPRRTSRQLDTLPYGPYIAVAALLILLFHGQVNQRTREFLMLGPAPLVHQELIQQESERR